MSDDYEVDNLQPQDPLLDSGDETEEDRTGDQTAVSTQRLPVVAIGASAGGLRALQRFFQVMPSDSGVAFVVVTHLSPEHESHLASLLQPYTRMPVLQVSDTVQIEPDHIYVIPPNRNLSAIDTHLRLDPLEAERRARAPIDHFLRTLAQAQLVHPIAVILSGTGTDGALGLQSIKEAGGLTVVQAPTDAEYDSMPQGALATGQVDLALPVHEIPAKLLDYVQSAHRVPFVQEEQRLNDEQREALQKIVAQVRARTGHDFSRYKLSTIMRRTQRRMQIHGIEGYDDYLALLRMQEDEVHALFNDFLVTVTNFFRDPQAFEALEQEVIPQLFQNKGEGEHVRVWVIGCATGEEAYSLAILLLEYAGRLESRPSLQVFASDLSEEALRRGREAFYPETIAADVSPERLQRFFVKEQGGYRVRKEVRELVLFAPHNLLKDPPFSRLDLITCRNLLIYLDRAVQRQLFDLFHYALRPGGFLFLGPSEVLEGQALFVPVNKKASLYRRQDAPVQEIRLPAFPLMAPERPLTGEPAPAGHVTPSGYAAIYNRLLERYAPPSLLINADFNIVYFSSGVSRYLDQPAGEPTNHVFKRVREELRAELAAVLYRAAEKREPSASAPVPMRLDGEMRQVIINAWPALEPSMHGLVLLIFFESAERQAIEEYDLPERDQENALREMEEELAMVRRRLQATIEEFETSKEEMKAANEELQSMNEELRSTAEELETSKEELQSINEELITVNQENKNKVEELSQLTSDLQNLLAATDIATLFLDRELRITRFTPRVGELFNVLATDRGRPIAHITHKLGYGGLLEDAETVLRTLTSVEREVPSEAGRHYLMRLLPYRTVDDRIDGIVVTFVDITQIRRTESEFARLREQLTDERALLEALLEALLGRTPAGVMVVEASGGRVTLRNRQMQEIVGDVREGMHFAEWRLYDMKGQPLSDEAHPLARAMATGEVVSNLRVQGERPDGVHGIYAVSAAAVRNPDGEIVGAVLIVRDEA